MKKGEKAGKIKAGKLKKDKGSSKVLHGCYWRTCGSCMVYLYFALQYNVSCVRMCKKRSKKEQKFKVKPV